MFDNVESLNNNDIVNLVHVILLLKGFAGSVLGVAKLNNVNVIKFTYLS